MLILKDHGRPPGRCFFESHLPHLWTNQPSKGMVNCGERLRTASARALYKAEEEVLLFFDGLLPRVDETVVRLLPTTVVAAVEEEDDDDELSCNNGGPCCINGTNG